MCKEWDSMRGEEEGGETGEEKGRKIDKRGKKEGKRGRRNELFLKEVQNE